MPQVTESRSCILSSTIHIFTKLRSLSLLPKAWTKWKKLRAVLPKPSSSFLDKFLQALRLKHILQRVILLLVLVIFSTPKKWSSQSLFYRPVWSSASKRQVQKNWRKKYLSLALYRVCSTSAFLTFHCCQCWQ